MFRGWTEREHEDPSQYVLAPVRRCGSALIHKVQAADAFCDRRGHTFPQARVEIHWVFRENSRN